MPAVTRELTVTYGSTTVGGTSDVNLLHGPVLVDRSYGVTRVSFEVFVRSDTEANFGTNVRNLLSAFRTPRQDLTVVQGSETLLSLSHSSNTGMNAAPRIRKSDRGNTGRSQRYVVEIDFDEPADLSGTSGRQTATERLTIGSNGVRTITLRGVYTALSGNGAKAQYDSAVATYASGVISALGGGATYELLSEDVQPDDEDKRLDFSRVYRELIADQSQAGRDHAALKGATMRVRPARVAPGDSDTTASRLGEISVSYRAAVDKTQSTDLKGLWDGTILPHIAQRVRTLSGASSLALVRSEPDFDPDTNTIQATMSWMGVLGGNLIESRTERTVTRGQSEFLVPVYNGDPLARDKYEIHLDKLLQVETRKLEVGSAGEDAVRGPVIPQQGEGGEDPATGGWEFLDEDEAGPVEGEAPDGWEFLTAIESRRRLSIGVTEYQFEVLGSVRSALYQRANVVTVTDIGGGGGGGGSGGTVG